MIDPLSMKIVLPCLIVLGACDPADGRSRAAGVTTVSDASGARVAQNVERTSGAGRTGKALPAKYLRAFACDFDENPLAAYERTRGTPAGRAERASELTLLRSLGFDREGRNGGQDSLGGKIAARPGLTILGLPVRSLEIAGMVGDVNAMFVTTFDQGVSVAQIARAARLEFDRKTFVRYKTRYYSRQVGTNPPIRISLDDRGSADTVLVCQFWGTPD